MSLADLSNQELAAVAERKDVYRDVIDEQTANTGVQVGMVVLRNFADADTVAETESTMRAWLAPHAPLRFCRAALAVVMRQQDCLPRFLQQQPLQLPIGAAHLLPDRVADTVERIVDVNRAMFRTEAVQAKYGSQVIEPDFVRFNRTPTNRYFPAHVDKKVFGFGYALQLVPTDLVFGPSGDFTMTENFRVRTRPGDLLVIAERTMADTDSDEVTLPGVNQSLEHTGVSMIGRPRYGMALFADNY